MKRQELIRQGLGRWVIDLSLNRFEGIEKIIERREEDDPMARRVLRVNEACALPSTDTAEACITSRGSLETQRLLAVARRPTSSRPRHPVVPVKALSVKQPWPNMIAAGEKTIETRTWVTTSRGPLLIVSSKRPRIEPAGFAVAVATLTGCRPMTRKDEKAACCRVYPSAHAWILADIRKIEPVPVKGSLGIFDCPLEPEDPTYIQR